ncbi:MAG TPA: UDP-diphosphatase [Porphyromonadaceae bacterium]|nr:UDP-diphosphatase [Porphyromonadaceae bacterium]
MDILKALCFGILQGVAEFLPISSSSHIALLNSLWDMEEEILSFAVWLHIATALSTIVVFRKEIYKMFFSLCHWKWDEETKYILKIFISMIPVGIVGVLFKDYVETLFGGGTSAIGFGLWITSLLLMFAHRISQRTIQPFQKHGFKEAFLMGLAQAFAVLPGLSRSGTTISTGIFLRCDKREVTKFSFLMAVIPILGEAFLDILKGEWEVSSSNMPNMMISFLTAFGVGILCCKAMIRWIERGKLIYFSIYCFVIGAIAIFFL